MTANLTFVSAYDPGMDRADLELVVAIAREGSLSAAARELRTLAASNRPAETMIGLGYHATITPPARKAATAAATSVRAAPVLMPRRQAPRRGGAGLRG